MKQHEYDHVEIERKWQKAWESSKCHETLEDSTKKKYYVLEMFLYPSGNIHMGHVRNYSIGDVVARFKKAQGFNVLHPMGWDAFGLPAENAAIQNKLHPNDWTIKNIADMKKQLQSLGFLYDWSREINTSQPEYYKHEQAMFSDFLAAGLAYQKESLVNWDPVDCTVLANEQVIDGKGWRSGASIEKKKLKQWFLKITNFADELLTGLDELPEWPDNVKTMQRNWIGKSEGAEIRFKVDGLDEYINVFSTRPETIFGATFICIAHDHEFAKNVKDSAEKDSFSKRCKQPKESSEIESTTEKYGIFTGYYAIHPFALGKKVPIYMANYIQSDYGTGAIFGCPAHDARDFEFAKKYTIEIIEVLRASENEKTDLPYIKSIGTVINSDFLDGLSCVNAKSEVIKKLESIGIGKRKTTYKLKDWGVSRQRYWGCPIPIIYCKYCGVIPVPKEVLPVKLPKDISFDGDGNPLDNHPTWK
jgi:leucyl-tRNA synthetase